MKAVSLTRLVQWLSASLWFIPAVAALAAFGSVKLLVAIDRSIDQDRKIWYLFLGEAESARQLLSTISASMMTFTGLVFTLTVLVLQQASNQFSPRVLRAFLEDRVTQVAMATFVGTFVFALSLLPEVRSPNNGGAEFVPGVSVQVAFLLVLVSVGIFINYLDHMAHAIRAVNIIKRVAAETRHAIERMHPLEAPKTPETPLRRPEGNPEVIHYNGPAGVLSAVDEQELMQLACRCDAVVELTAMPGDFVPRGAPLFRVWGHRPPNAETLHDSVFMANERTIHQDPAFGFRQLVDIAERALSPGINDPTTAVQVLDETHDLLRGLTRRHYPSPLRADENGALRLIIPRPDWAGYVRLALDEIRLSSNQSIQVPRRMRHLIEDCLSVASPDQRHSLEEQLRLLTEAIPRNIDAERDRRLARTGSSQGHN